MTNDEQMPELRMHAYYYGFEPTGVRHIDLILSAVACAGKSFHSTEFWNDDASAYDVHTGSTPVEWIQNAADQAADLCASGQQVRSVRWRVFESAFGRGCWGIEIDGDLDADAILPPQKLAREDLVAIVDAHNAALTPAPQAAQEAVPVAWGESYDGGAFFNTVSLTKTKHHTYPLYAHPPQPSVSVAAAAKLADAIEACDWSGSPIGNKMILRAAVKALRALKGEQ